MCYQAPPLPSPHGRGVGGEGLRPQFFKAGSGAFRRAQQRAFALTPPSPPTPLPPWGRGEQIGNAGEAGEGVVLPRLRHPGRRYPIRDLNPQSL